MDSQEHTATGNAAARAENSLHIMNIYLVSFYFGRGHSGLTRGRSCIKIRIRGTCLAGSADTCLFDLKNIATAAVPSDQSLHPSGVGSSVDGARTPPRPICSR